MYRPFQRGEGLGVELTSWSRKGHGFANNERINLTYRTGKLDLFANLFGAYNKRWEKGEFEQTVFADTLWVITNKQKDKVYNPFLEGRFGEQQCQQSRRRPQTPSESLLHR